MSTAPASSSFFVYEVRPGGKIGNLDMNLHILILEFSFFYNSCTVWDWITTMIVLIVLMVLIVRITSISCHQRKTQPLRVICGHLAAGQEFKHF